MRRTDYVDFMRILGDKDLARYLTTKEKKDMAVLVLLYASNNYDYSLHSDHLIRLQDVVTTIYAACNMGIIGGDNERASNDK